VGPLILAALIASVSAVVFTLAIRRVALALGVVDRPDGVRKLHKSPVPLLGGISVCGAWILGTAGSGPLWRTITQSTEFAARPGPWWAYLYAPLGPALLLAVAIVLVLGSLDDAVTLRARTKLLGQAVAAGILVAGGLAVERLWLFGHTVELSRPVGIAFTLIWLIGSMNAMNMLDGMDGLASTVGLVTSLILAGMAWITHHPALSLIMAAQAGALAGFLVLNLPPARIYLGDSGSTLIGLLVGAVAIRGSFKAPATVALLAPLAVLTIPIFDGLAAVVRRRLTGTSVCCPDRGHIHHCLHRRGWSNRQILALVGSLCALTGLAALASLYLRSEPVAMLAMLVVLCGCVATKLFGYFECLLLLAKPSALWAALSGGLYLESSAVALLCYRLRQCRSVDEVWTALLEAAKPMRLYRMELKLATPGAPFRARWEAPESNYDGPIWATSLSLTAEGSVLGEFIMGGDQHRKSVLANMVSMALVARTLAAVCSRMPKNSVSVLPMSADGTKMDRNAFGPAKLESHQKEAA
jgi:UDP-GlcNAc:undecaprenyl-phosphate/decaprenyl-phosphate GlcNAc-1-phosphate transferase